MAHIVISISPYETVAAPGDTFELAISVSSSPEPEASGWHASPMYHLSIHPAAAAFSLIPGSDHVWYRGGQRIALGNGSRYLENGFWLKPGAVDTPPGFHDVVRVRGTVPEDLPSTLDAAVISLKAVAEFSDAYKCWGDQVIGAAQASLLIVTAGAKSRLAEIGASNDQAELAGIARTDIDARVRKAAVAKLTDQAALAEAAKSDDSADVRLCAAYRLADYALLEDIAQTASDSHVRRVAAESLREIIARTKIPSALAKIAKTSPDASLRRIAVERLADPSLLAEIAKRATDAKTGAMAARKIADPSSLAEIAAMAVDPVVRRTAVERLEDQRALEEAARRDADPEVRKAAESRLRAKGWPTNPRLG